MANDSLVSLPEYLVAPRSVKPSDFPSVGTPDSEAGGKDTLTPVVWNARANEDDGYPGHGTPVPTDRSRVVASSFPVGQSTAGAGTSMSIPSTVSLETGYISPDPRGMPKGPDVTKVKVNQRSN